MAIDELHVADVCSPDSVRTIKTTNYGACYIGSYEGKTIPVIDISGPNRHCTESMAVLILRLHLRYVALLVDAVRETVELASDEIYIANEPKIDEQSYIHGHFVLGSSIIVVMDVERFFSPILKP